MDKKIINPQNSSSINENQNNNLKSNNKKDEIIISSQAKYDENKINEEFIKKSDVSNNNKDDTLPELKIKSEPENSKKVVIEEVGAEFKQIIPMKRKILSDTEMEVKFFFD